MSKMHAILASGVAPALLTPAYANDFNDLIPDLYMGIDVVSRELAGFVTSATRAPGVERAAVGQQVSYPIAPPQTAYDIVPAMTIPEPPDNTFDVGTMAITKARAVPFGITGEEYRGLSSGGPGMPSVQAQWVAQAIRTIVNEMEADGAAEAAANASRAYGTPGTTPFGSGDLTDMAQIQKILTDNGAPATGRSMILNTAAGAKMMALNNLTRANEAGTTMTLRQGELLDIYGMSIKQTGQPVSHTKGTGASATTTNAGFAVGATTIALASAGTGTIKAGDTITFAGDTNKYVVVSGDTDVSNGGSITIAAPGLRVAIPAATTAITVGNSYSANVAFTEDALHVAMRPPALPPGGDAADDRLTLIDPRSGIPFEFAVYRGYKKVRWEVGMAWGWKATKREHIALLLG